MKKFSSLHKGFTLVELMIVIAIIGILAAVLYPAMTGYFERSRDTNRQGALRNVALALHAYKTDNLQYPGSTTTKCLSDISNNLTPASGQTYIKSLPTDPNKLNVDGCADGSYGYKWTKESTSGTAAGGSSIIAANMEIKGNATMPKSVWADSVGIVSADVINLTAKTNPHADLATNNTKGEWYLTMAQE